jgi:transaldolase
VKFFLDTANVDEIRAVAEMGMLDGVTTNPSHAAKAGRDFREVVTEIAGICAGPVSAESISLDTEGIMADAREVTSWAPNVVVKIPLIQPGIKAIRMCADEGIKTNVTLCFNATQALIAAKAGASFISPFVGRLDDIGHNGMDLVREIATIYDNYAFDTEIIVASARGPQHVLQAALIGADITTMPYAVFQMLLSHPLSDIGEKKFLDDWNQAGLKIR